MNTNWIQRIRHIINYLTSKSRRISVFIVAILAVILLRFFPWHVMGGGMMGRPFIFMLLIGLWYIFKDITLNPRYSKAVKHLRRAIDFIRTKDYASALNSMIIANKAYPNRVLEDLIKDFSSFYDLENYSEMDMLEREISKTKDKKNLRILSEIKKTLKYLAEHTEKLNSIKQKITSLRQEMIQAPDTYKPELQDIINRYENLRQLEEAKISFYNELKNELWQLHRQYLYRNKIEQERQRLSDLEKEYLTDSVIESMEADERKGFVDYENAYLDALAEYSDEINGVTSTDLFDEIRREFENKKSNLKTQ